MNKKCKRIFKKKNFWLFSLNIYESYVCTNKLILLCDNFYDTLKIQYENEIYMYVKTNFHDQLRT